MGIKAKPNKDNTRYIQMVDRRGNICPIAISPRHGNELEAIEYHRRKGFRTLDEVERDAEFERLQRENEELRAQAEAKAEAEAAAKAQAAAEKKAEKQAQAAAAKK